MVLLEAVLPFVGVLVGLILIHEAGHYVTAKMAHVRVEEFGVGFPPRLRGKRIGETIYSINWLPLGGFVRLTGEESARVFIESVNPHGAAAGIGMQARDVIIGAAGRRVHNDAELAAALTAAAEAGAIRFVFEREISPGSGGAWDYYAGNMPIGPARPSDDADAAPADAPTDDADAAPADAPEAAPEAASDGPAETPAATIGRIAGMQVGPDPRSFGSRSPLTRIGILAAGALINLVLPILLFALAAMIPQDRAAGPAVVTSVVRGGPADLAGFQAGDRVLSVDGVTTPHRGELGLQIRLNVDRDIEVVLERDTMQPSASQQPGVASREVIVTRLTPRLAPPELVHTVREGDTVHDVAEILGVNASQVLEGAGLGGGVALDEGLVLDLPSERYVVQKDDTAFSVARDFGLRQQMVLDAAGIDLIHLQPGLEVVVEQGPTGITVANGSLNLVRQSSGPLAALVFGAERTRDTFILTYNLVRGWIAGGEPLTVNGPVGLAQGTGEIVRDAGWLRLIELAALISLSLGILNLLPIPGLDGGRIVFVLLEIVRRGKRISPQKEGLVHLAGFALLIGAALVISYFDIVRVIQGEPLLR